MLFGVQRILQLGAVGLLHAVVNGLIERQRSHNNLLGLDLIVELLDCGDDFLDLGVAEFERFHNFLFGNFERAGFHHHDAVCSASDNNVELAGLLFGNRRIGDQLAIEQAHANGGDGIAEGQIGTIRGGGSSGNGDDIGIVIAVRGEHHGDNLGLIAPGIGEQRAHRAVNQAGNKNFFFGRAAFTLEESSRDFAGGICIFAIIHGQRKKIPVVRLIGHARAYEQNGVAIASGDRTVRLLGDFTGLKDQGTSPDLDGYLKGRWCVVIL